MSEKCPCTSRFLASFQPEGLVIRRSSCREALVDVHAHPIAHTPAQKELHAHTSRLADENM